MERPSFKPVADCALLVEFGDQIDDAHNRSVIALDQAIQAANVPGIREIVPALVNLMVVFDPLVTDHTLIQDAITDLLPADPKRDSAVKIHDVPVCYDAELCPDLLTVAKATGLSTEAVATAHLNTSLKAAMYGFAPGYAYLTGLDRQIQVPRKPAAVRNIPKGSVMIAGPMCLLTTLDMPTGWSIIGRTGIEILQDDPERPGLFDVGDMVKFYRVSRADLPEKLQTP